MLYGNGGADTFAFSSALGAGNVDRVTDFDAGDTIRLDDAIFAGLSPGGLDAGAFKDIGVAGARLDAGDRVLYNHNSGILYYDADGSGATKAVAFAILDTRPSLTFQDVQIV